MKKAVALLLFISLLLFLVACGTGADISPACVGYAAGKADETSFAWHEGEKLILPAEFVRTFAAYALKGEGESAVRVIYDDNAVYMKALLDEHGISYGEALEQINECAKKEGLGLVFGSLCGTKGKEKDLLDLFGLENAFEESSGSLEGLKKTAEKFTQNETIMTALSTDRYRFSDGQSKARMAPLVSDSDQYRLENALFYLGGYGIKDGKSAYIALGAVEEQGTPSFAAVCEISTGEEPYRFAPCDVGNLCGQALGQKYNLAYSTSRDPDKAGMTVGASIFGGVILVIVIAVGVLFLAAAAFGIFGVVKRNREGRKKYKSK